jgi:phenylalanine ammonia-lyase
MDASFLIQQDRELASFSEKTEIGCQPLTIRDVIAVARGRSEVAIATSPALRERVAKCHQVMMDNIQDGVPVYGCNTAYGARASLAFTEGSLSQRDWCARAISEAIAAIDVSVGPAFEQDIVRAGMLIRIQMLLGGFSGVKLADLELFGQLLNSSWTPLVNQYGGVGASGDLAHNARVLSVMRNLPGAMVIDGSGSQREASMVFPELGIPALQLDPKAGLAFCNGDNFSTGIGILLAVDTLRLLMLVFASSAMTVEVLLGSDRSFHPMLGRVRPHPGQIEAAYLLRELLAGSQLATQEMQGFVPRPQGVSVQDGYSLRALPQFLAVAIEQLQRAFDVLSRNANSVSDNPLWVPPEFTVEGETPWQWVSGANFLAMHVAEVIDGLRKSMTQLVKLCDRHLARIVNPDLNNGLPANLSGSLAVTTCSFKGVQIQAGMFDVYSQILSIPVTTLFGVHEEGNQDITTHAITSGILAAENLRIARYSVAQNFLSIAQAVDLRGGPEYLAPRTRPIYEFIRSRCEHVNYERPLHQDIEIIYRAIVSDELGRTLREQTFCGLENKA